MDKTPSKIDEAKIIEDIKISQNKNTLNNTLHNINNSHLEINRLFYFFGIILMIIVYLGPFVYFKYYKKKNFIPGSSNMGVKHAI